MWKGKGNKMKAMVIDKYGKNRTLREMDKLIPKVGEYDVLVGLSLPIVQQFVRP
jgi:hypothetical protein